MPLILNTPETDRIKHLLWNSRDLDEHREMLETIVDLTKQGFRGTVDADKGMAVLYPPSLDPKKFVMRVLTENGDDRLVWDRHDLEQIEEARQKYNEYVKKGYKAYAVRQTGGEKGSRLDSFDDLFEEVVMVKGKDALMVPPTVPG